MKLTFFYWKMSNLISRLCERFEVGLERLVQDSFFNYSRASNMFRFSYSAWEEDDWIG